MTNLVISLFLWCAFALDISECSIRVSSQKPKNTAVYSLLDLVLRFCSCVNLKDIISIVE